MKVCGRVCETGETITLTLEGGKITAALVGAEAGALGGADVWLAPGFCDVQLNGYGGHDFNHKAWGGVDEVNNELRPLFQKVARAGTALLCPTITTNSFEAMSGSLSALDRFLDSDPQMAHAVPGIHVEGPYIASEDGPRGAHPLEYVRDPDWDEFQRLQEAAGGRIKLFTLAPEREGSLPFIEKLAASGVVVSLGHTGAEPETIRDAIRAGAKMSTHLGNGAHSQIRRHPNYIWEQLAADELYAGIIPDGHHLPASVVKSFARVKGPEKIAIVSDAVALGGQAPGIYMDGRYEVLPTGKIVLAGTPYLAGAGHLLDTCAANALRFTDFSLAQVVGCVTSVPARILGLESRKGHLQVGYDADLTLFRVKEQGPLEIVATVCGGEAVFTA
ncbi:MAG TPA: amidohydrolase family protein [Chthonomonadaceae bacterium]|nr:amidohydrolase family protein [Chthonomonadaceae bacterium]